MEGLQKMSLHERPTTLFGSNLVTKMISETSNIVDAIKSTISPCLSILLDVFFVDIILKPVYSNKDVTNRILLWLGLEGSNGSGQNS